MLPNFFIIGAMKSGTTSLYAYLKEHPEIGMPYNKEPNFFSNDLVWNRGVEWYESLFEGLPGSKMLGEASVNYTKYPYYKNVPERIASVVPHAKLIYLLRSPVERIYSHYIHNVYANLENLPFEKAVHEKPLYIQVSRYYTQIEQYLKYFPKENLLVILLDDLKGDPLGSVQNVFSFLEVDSRFIPSNIREIKHRSSSKRGRDNLLMKIVRSAPCYHQLKENLPKKIKCFEYFAGIILKRRIKTPASVSEDLFRALLIELDDDIAKLTKFLNRDLSSWYDFARCI